MGTKQIKILIVDDCPVMRHVVQRTISITPEIEATVLEAGDGKEGLDKIREHRPDLVIADVNMPEMSGLDMIDLVRQDEALDDIPILTVSTESNEPRIEKIRNVSADFVHKPFSPELLQQKMLKLLEKGSIKERNETTSARLLKLNRDFGH